MLLYQRLHTCIACVPNENEKIVRCELIKPLKRDARVDSCKGVKWVGSVRPDPHN